MAKNSYEWVLVEIMENPGGECSREEIRLRPVGHPVYPPRMRVSCNRKIRRKTATGDKFLLWCCLVEPRTRENYLYIHPDREWHMVNKTQELALLRGETITVAGHPVNFDAPLTRTYHSYARRMGAESTG